MNQLNPTELFPNTPEEELKSIPCSVLAVGLRLKALKKKPTDMNINYDGDGYCKLKDMDTALRINCKVSRYHYIKKGYRKKLKEYTLFPGKYVVCVLGHYIYVEQDNYYSFFDNSEDIVIAWWRIR